MAGQPPTDFDERLGKRLRSAREGAGLSQKGLAGTLGVSAAQLQKYERGSNRTPASVVQSAARRLGVPIGDFFDPETKAVSRRGQKAGTTVRA